MGANGAGIPTTEGSEVIEWRPWARDSEHNPHKLRRNVRFLTIDSSSHG